MHKVTGSFDTKSLALVLALDRNDSISRALYFRLKEYIQQSMFIRYRKESVRFDHMRLSSIGDHLDKYGNQKISEADLYLDIIIPDDIKPSPRMVDVMNEMDEWAIIVKLIDTTSNKITESFTFIVRNRDEMIMHPEIIL